MMLLMIDCYECVMRELLFSHTAMYKVPLPVVCWGGGEGGGCGFKNTWPAITAKLNTTTELPTAKFIVCKEQLFTSILCYCVNHVQKHIIRM
jgi:hypothetical protein